MFALINLILTDPLFALCSHGGDKVRDYIPQICVPRDAYLLLLHFTQPVMRIFMWLGHATMEANKVSEN